MAWQTPIIDRTQEDVDSARALAQIDYADMTDEQKAQWDAGLKGCLNASDLERIVGNVDVLAECLNIPSTEIEVPNVPSVTFWTELLNNVSAVRDAHGHEVSTPAVPTIPINTFAKVNAIEKIERNIMTAYINDADCGDELECDDVSLL